ncbi:MAG TPA: hypothetical protein PLK30_15405 [Blastocatellia bacterium]|nr:hypothetical protein [Blastocatellia bacterium]
MAKKNLLMALAVLVFASATALAQVERDAARPGLMTVYEDWKQKELATKGELSEHLAMAVISQRIDDGRAQLDFALINKINDSKLGNELMLEIQPMVILRDADGKPVDSQAVGHPTRTSITADENGELSSPTTVSVLVPADPRADAVMVKWVLSKRMADEKQVLSNNTMHLLLGEAPNSALMAITKLKSVEQ